MNIKSAWLEDRSARDRLACVIYNEMTKMESEARTENALYEFLFDVRQALQ